MNNIYKIDNFTSSEKEFLALCKRAKNLRPDLFDIKRDTFPRVIALERLKLFRSILNRS